MADKKSSKAKTENDKGGNNIHIGGSVSGSNIVVGNHNKITQSNGLSGDEIAKLFAIAYQKIEARPEDPQVDKEEITQTVQRIEQETVKGEEANPGKVERLLTTLSGMAPDIGEVILASLTNPAVGIAAVIRKVAQKAKEEAQTSS
jgi:uncharacterized protein associated with vWA-MoxR-VMAP ternary system